MNRISKYIKLYRQKIKTWVYFNIVPFVDRYRTTRAITQLNLKHKHDRIKVGFIVQMPQIWDKEAPVYELMEKDKRFDPWLIVVPEYDISIGERKDYGRELLFFVEMYPNANILSSKDLSVNFTGLEKYGFDYIFYQRCWEAYLPSSLRTQNVIKFAKTCYIPYGYHELCDPQDYYRTRFFYGLYTFYCCSSEQYDSYSPRGKQRSVYLGYPSLGKLFINQQPLHEGIRILWTPRWETSLQYGGSTFYDYKDYFVPYHKSHPEDNIVMRPHPLTFQNAVRMGRMTNAEIDQYKTTVINAGIMFDENADIATTLKQIDVMITDLSSVIITAFLSGVILIYCGKDTDARPTKVLQEILECSYRANTWEDIVNILDNTRNNIDPLRYKRVALAESIRKVHIESDHAIVEDVFNDYHRAIK